MNEESQKSGELRKKYVVVNDSMQRGYRYELSAPIGRNFDPDFNPELTPQQLLELGVFCGKYMTNSQKEFPKSWFKHAKFSASGLFVRSWGVSGCGWEKATVPRWATRRLGVHDSSFEKCLILTSRSA